MTNIQWSQFEKNQQAKDISFESFCFQVAYIKFKDYGYFENFYNTPGSEYYLTLHSDCPELNLKEGDEIGWQVKWWFNSEDNTSLTARRRNELERGFATTLKRHPNIKLWIICTPGSFVEDKFIELKATLTKLKRDINISHWNKNSFSNFLTQQFYEFNNVFNHYFNTNFIGFEFINKYSKRRIEDLQKKFDTDLYTPSHYDDEIFFVMNYKEIFKEIDILIKYLQDDLVEIEEDSSYNYEFKAFNQKYIDTAQELLKKCVETSKDAISIILSGLTIEKAKFLESLLLSFEGVYRKSADIITKMIQSEEYIVDKNNYNEIHKNEEYIIPSIIKIREYLIFSKENEDSCILDLISDSQTKDIHILSSAGYGKTNIACNICLESLKKDIPSLLILGSSFRKNELPQTQILEQLEINTHYTFKQFLQALNTIGFTKGIKIPIIIDGLNESKPFDDIWKSNIKDIIRDIKELNYVLLITTCRNRYVEAIFEEPDITKIPNIKTLRGLTEKQRFEAIPKYFKKYNIVPSSWNFNQELFIDPLLLKIFSVVNKDSNNLHISLGNVYESIDKYIDEIEKNSSKVNSKIDKIAKKHVESQIRLFCEHLWSNNTREVSDYEFNKIISPESATQMGDLTKKLLDEGLCFQKNLRNDEETVQFTYDKVAGYAIASKVLLNNNTTTPESVKDNLIKLGIEKMLFNKETFHPLRQDILMSLLHLLPNKFGIQLFELFENKSVLKESYNNIDYFINDPEGQEKIFKYILKEKRESRNFKILFEKLFENNYIKEVHGLGEFTIRILSVLTQIEIDINWSELIRKNKNIVFPLLKQINKSYVKSTVVERNNKQDLYLSFLSTTSSDKSIRSLAAENIFLIGKKYPEMLLKFSNTIISFSDISSVESVIVAICGTVLSIKEKAFTQSCLLFFENQFIPNFNSTHFGIIEYIFIVLEFAKSYYSFDYVDRIRLSKEHYNIAIDKEFGVEVDEELHPFNPFGIDMYEFNKYQIRSIASDHYGERDSFSSSQCRSIILSNIKRKGYNESIFEEINKDFQNSGVYKYRTRNGNNNLMAYSEKYLWQTYFEFVGFLILDGKLKPKGNTRYRCSDLFYDPNFPKLPRKFQLVTKCFFPINNENIQEWIDSQENEFIDNFLIHNLHSENEWVLTSLNISQDGKENDTRIDLWISSFLIPKSNIEDLERSVKLDSFHHSSISNHYIFAGEINWSSFAIQDSEESYNYELKLIDIMQYYSWTSSTNAIKNDHFEFINPELFNLLNLKFNPDTLCFYNERNEQVTKIVWAEDSKLYYIRKDIIKEIMEKMKMEYIWYQFVTKFGEFRNLLGKKLNPSYKELRKVIKFSDVDL